MGCDDSLFVAVFAVSRRYSATLYICSGLSSMICFMMSPMCVEGFVGNGLCRLGMCRA